MPTMQDMPFWPKVLVSQSALRRLCKAAHICKDGPNHVPRPVTVMQFEPVSSGKRASELQRHEVDGGPGKSSLRSPRADNPPA